MFKSRERDIKKAKQLRHVRVTKNEGDSFVSQIFTRESFPSIFFLKMAHDGKHTRKTPGTKSEDVVNTRTRARNEKTEEQGAERARVEKKPSNSTVAFDFWFCIAARRPGTKAFREFFQLGEPHGRSSKLSVALYSSRFFISVIAVLNNCISIPPYHHSSRLRDVPRCFFHRTGTPVTRDF